MIRKGLRVAAALAVCVLGTRVSASDDDTRSELWPEIDAYVRLKPGMKLYLLAAFSSARKEGYSEGQYGIHYDVSWFRKRQVLLHGLTERANDEKFRAITFRFGYRYNGTIEDAGDPFREHRGILELHLRYHIKGGLLLADRNRVDLRWIDGVRSTRYRNRLLLERETGIGDYRFTPYTSAEIYYDSRYDTWNRNRFGFGIQTPFHPRVMLDSYYMRQNDTRSQPAHVNALGIALNLFF